MDERGKYITLLCMQVDRGAMTEKEMEIAVGELTGDLLSKFVAESDGKRYNKRMRKEIQKAVEDEQSQNALACVGTVSQKFGEIGHFTKGQKYLNVRLELANGKVVCPTIDQAVLWKQQFPDIKVRNELLKIQAWLEKNRSKRKTLQELEPFITTWLANADNEATRASSDPRYTFDKRSVNVFLDIAKEEGIV